MTTPSKDELVLPPLPKPPRWARIQGWVLSVGVMMLGITAFSNSLVTYASFGLVQKDSEARACVSDLAAADQRAAAEVNKGLATALLEVTQGASDIRINELAANLDRLIVESDQAADRRANSDIICDS